jgi:hypothetical protein
MNNPTNVQDAFEMLLKPIRWQWSQAGLLRLEQQMNRLADGSVNAHISGPTGWL